MSNPSLSAEQVIKKSLDSEMISADQLYALMQSKPAHLVLLDVRTELEYKQGVIPGSKLFPCNHDLDNLENTVPFSADFHQKFSPDLFDQKNVYVLICRTGPRTAIALETFLEHELLAFELLGGVTEWSRLGYQLQDPKQSDDLHSAA